MTDEQTHAREARIRQALDKAGYTLRKSCRTEPTPDDWGEYMIVDPTINMPVAGWNFDFTLDDVEDWLSSEAS